MNKLAVKNIVDDALYKALESDLTSRIQSFQTFRTYTVGAGAAGSEHRLALGTETWSISATSVNKDVTTSVLQPSNVSQGALRALRKDAPQAAASPP